MSEKSFSERVDENTASNHLTGMKCAIDSLLQAAKELRDENLNEIKEKITDAAIEIGRLHQQVKTLEDTKDQQKADRSSGYAKKENQSQLNKLFAQVKAYMYYYGNKSASGLISQLTQQIKNNTAEVTRQAGIADKYNNEISDFLIDLFKSDSSEPNQTCNVQKPKSDTDNPSDLREILKDELQKIRAEADNELDRDKAHNLLEALRLEDIAMKKITKINEQSNQLLKAANLIGESHTVFHNLMLENSNNLGRE